MGGASYCIRPTFAVSGAWPGTRRCKQNRSTGVHSTALVRFYHSQQVNQPTAECIPLLSCEGDEQSHGCAVINPQPQLDRKSPAGPVPPTPPSMRSALDPNRTPS